MIRAKSEARERERFASMSLFVIARSASDEAIQGPLAHALDCFAALAMTSGKRGDRRPSRLADFVDEHLRMTEMGVRSSR
jgi:hypothetical protein